MIHILKDKRLLSFAIVFVLFAFLFYSSLIFIDAFIFALLIFVISRPSYNWLKRRGLSKAVSAWIVMLSTLVIIVIPLYFIIQGLIEQITIIPQTIRNLDAFIELINQYVPFELELNRDKIIQQIVPFLERSLTPIFSNIINTAANFVLFYFLVYYMLVNDKAFLEKVRKILPYSDSNKTKVINKFGEITKATVIGSVLIALIQGGMLAIGFYALGIQGALFWGFVTAILSFVPVVGSPLVWGPACIFLLMEGFLTKAIILLIWGLLITTVDNVIRPFTNKKYGEIHPLVSVVGVFIGLAQFGFIGIFIGPLFVAYFLLFLRIYKEEYLDEPKKLKTKT